MDDTIQNEVCADRSDIDMNQRSHKKGRGQDGYMYDPIVIYFFKADSSPGNGKHCTNGQNRTDVDFGYISNDRSEFEDSEVAVLQMKLKTFNYNANYHFPKLGNSESIFGIQVMHHF